VAGEELTYDGIAILDLRVDSVTWTPGQAQHVCTRSGRYPGAVNLEPERATEAAMDPKRRFGVDPASKTGEGIRVVGRSATAAQVLTVIPDPERAPSYGGPPLTSADGRLPWLTPTRRSIVDGAAGIRR
jgi:hypothetical protein